MTVDYKFSKNNKKEIENFVGIEIYSTPNLSGIGGKYKDDPKDFIVKEITEDGKVLEMKEDHQSSPFLKRRDDFTTFNLIKINKSTFEALNQIAGALGIPTSIISYSGLKDKHSISVQKVSIRGNFVEEIKNLNIKDIFIRSITPTKKSVNLGSNRGNHFELIIRNLEPKINLKSHIEKIITQINEKGFPNYYGLQRFGRFRPNSHIIGKHILNQNYRKAFYEFVCKIYSLEHKNVSKHRRKIKKILDEDGDLEKAFLDFPRGLDYEWKMINYILDHPNDYEGSIKSLSPDLISLLINSFQSYLFNRMLSLRSKSGYPLDQPALGDVISILDDTHGTLTDIKYEYGDLYKPYLDQILKMNRGSIVIPLVGFKTKINEFPLIKQFFLEIINDQKIKMEIFDSPILKEYDLKGALRSMVVKPIGLKVNKFSDDECYKGKKKVKIEFSLPSGCYATMLLRELMKQ